MKTAVFPSRRFLPKLFRPPIRCHCLLYEACSCSGHGAVFAAPLRAQAQTVQLTVQPGDPKLLISKHIQGQFTERLGHCIYDGFWVDGNLRVPKQGRIRLEVVQALKKIHVPNLRWPGGCSANAYHWHDGVGPAAQRPKLLNLW